MNWKDELFTEHIYSNGRSIRIAQEHALVFSRRQLDETTLWLKLRHVIEMSSSGGGGGCHSGPGRWSKTGRGGRRERCPYRYVSRCTVMMVGRPAEATVELHVVVVGGPVYSAHRRCRVAAAVDRHGGGPRVVVRWSAAGSRCAPPVGVGRHHVTDAVVEWSHAADDVGGRRRQIDSVTGRRHVEKYRTRLQWRWHGATTTPIASTQPPASVQWRLYISISIRITTNRTLRNYSLVCTCIK